MAINLTVDSQKTYKVAYRPMNMCHLIKSYTSKVLSIKSDSCFHKKIM